jgi:hypothetical protein
MKRGILAILVVSLLLLVPILSVTQTKAQTTGNWISSYTITDLSTGQVLDQSGSNSPILSGEQLQIAITIQVTTSNPGNVLKLSTSLDHPSQGNYWQLQGSYAGIDSSTYNPNTQSVTFNQTIGTLTISCFGTISATITQSQTGISGLTLDKKVNKDLITLTDPANNKLDKVNVDIVDAALNEFSNKLASAQAEYQTLSSQGVGQAYLNLFQTVINGATAQANSGLVQSAIGTLDQLAAAENAAAPSSTGTPIEATLFIPAVIVLVIIVVLVAFMMVKARGKVSYDKLVIEDQIKDLEGLTLRASKVDRNLTASLESIKDRLKNLVEV